MQTVSRRRFLKMTSALALAIGQPGFTFGATTVPISDAHSHVGLHTPGMILRSLKTQMEESGVMLLSWNIVGDGKWTRRTNEGIKQVATPTAGDQALYFRQKLAAMRSYLKDNGLAAALTPADIDESRAGKPHVVIAVEGAGFAADGIEVLDKAYADGLRHVQLVHYIRNELGDIQTEMPEHNEMTALGVDVVKACNRLGILVDLAHSTNPLIDKALEISTTPIIWSHSMVSSEQFSWQRPSGLSRRLYIDYAKKIAAHGGAVGLWSLRNNTVYSPASYAAELMRMADAVGPEHVMFGTDLDGVGSAAALENLMDMRKVADALSEHGADDNTLNAICFDNYARCLKAAMMGRQAS